MRLPNGYGSVINLGKKRRKPFAVRITDGYKKNKKGESVQNFKYIGYFEKSQDAFNFLANYNSNHPVKEHISMIEKPTFEKVYNNWYTYRMNMNKKPSDATARSYVYAFNMCESLHDKKISELKVDDLQSVVDQYKDKSRGVVGNIKTLLYAMYRYALKHEYIDKDYSSLVDFEWSEERRFEHVNFKIDEIKLLWNNLSIKYVDWILILIYTGFRVSEFCELKTENIFIDKKYVIGGKKTDAGKNRMVPLHEDIIPLIKNIYNADNDTLVTNECGNELTYKTFKGYWDELMKTLGMEHLPHDTRYTTASLLDSAGANKVCIKKIMGHAIQDITDGVYIQKDLSELLEAINLIKI